MIIAVWPLAGFNIAQQPVRQCTSTTSSTNYPCVTEKRQQCFVFHQRLANGRNDPGRQITHAFRFRLHQYPGIVEYRHGFTARLNDHQPEFRYQNRSK